MSGLDDEKLMVQLRSLRRQDPPPRQEYVTYLDQSLVKQAQKMKKWQKAGRILSVTGGAAAAVMLALLVALPYGKEEASSVRVEQRIEDVPQQTSNPPVIVQKPPIQSQSGEQGKQHNREQSPVTTQPKTKPKTKPQTQVLPLPQKQVQPKPSAVQSNAPSQSVEQYIQQKLGEMSKQYRLVSNSQEKNVAVFQRVIHNVPFVDSVITVKLESDGKPAGMVIEENLDTEANLALFPNPAKAISKEEAMQKLTASLKQEEVAVFSGYVNALSGEVLDRRFQTIATADGPKLIPIQAKGKQLKASSKEEIPTFLAQELGVHIGQDNRPLATVEHEEYWEYTWKIADSTHFTARLANDSGQLLAYRIKKQTEPANSSQLSQAEAAGIGATKLATYLSTPITHLTVEGAVVEDSAIRLDYTAVTGGGRLDSHRYTVWVDSSSKQVIGMEGNFSESVGASKDDRPSLELVYVWPDINGKRAQAPYLVYQIN